MIVHQEVTIRHKADPDSRTLVQIFADFCTATPKRYSYLREESADYQKNISADACVIHRLDEFPFPLIALASNDGATMRVTNIIPQETSTIDTEIYNKFASDFTSDLQTFRIKTKAPIVVRCTKAVFTLEDILPSKKTRTLFKRFLDLHPTSYHPCDIRRLDAFICAAFRYCRSNLDCNHLQRYLIEVLRWKPEDAEWCCSRISTGLEILEVDRDFSIPATSLE